MKDYLGNELEVGDQVVFVRLNYRDLMKGTIIKLTPKMVRIGWKSKRYDGVLEDVSTVQSPLCVIKIMK